MSGAREIGGYPELEQLVRCEYYPNFVALNSARYALVYLIRARRIRKLYLPYLLCGSVSAVCAAEGCETVFYNIGHDYLPRLEQVEDGAWLYLVNYYGQLDNETILRIRRQYQNVIADNVQAFFQCPAEDTDTIYSCRKFFGVPDGAYLSTNAVSAEELPPDVSGGRLSHLIGRFEGEAASAYYANFKANDAALADCGMRAMSRLTHNLLGAIDYEAVKSRRNSNFAVLARAFDEVNPTPPHTPDGAFAYPLYVPNGMKIKKRLAARGIYVPTLWQDGKTPESAAALDMAHNTLPLPCDQRYDEQDMRRVIDEVKKCIG